MRITKRVFTDLAIYMIGFGLLIGIVFPFFMIVLGIPTSYLLTPAFILSCIAAGIIVGAINILLARTVVGKRISVLAEKMQYIADKLTHAETISDLEECNSDECRLLVDSEDELGESARSFNTLLQSLSEAISSEASVRSFNRLLAAQLELESLAKNALTFMMNYAEVTAGCVVIERGGHFTIPYSFGIRDTEPIIQNDNLWKLFESRKPQRISIDIGMQVDALLVAFQPNHVYISPLLYKDVPLGLILFGSDHLVSERILQTMELFNQSFAISLNNAITYDQLQKLAANDPLTGLYNRRFGMTRLSEEFIRSIRSQIPLGLLMFDIDHFKQVNDTFGHTAGDRVLVKIAKIATMAARKGDLIIRYGGEEFIMILPGADKKDCNFIAERLRHMVEESLVTAGDAQIRVTISIGLVSYPEYSVDEEQSLIRVADDALYVAKEKGRNVVVSA